MDSTVCAPAKQQAAHDLLARGFAIIPLHHIGPDGRCTCGQHSRPLRRGEKQCKPGKHPRIRQWQERASSDPEVVEGWAAEFPGCNWGVAVGPEHGLAVLDIDPRNGGDETMREISARWGLPPETLSVVTGGGGRHHYFLHEAGLRCKLAPGVEIIGAGATQYVVAPGSNHESGNLYVWENEAEIAPADWLLGVAERIKPQEDPSPPPQPMSCGSYVKADLANLDPQTLAMVEAAIVREVPVHGTRNTTTWEFARCVKQIFGDVNPADLLPIVRAWFDRHCAVLGASDYGWPEVEAHFCRVYPQIRHYGPAWKTAMQRAVHLLRHRATTLPGMGDGPTRAIIATCAALSEAWGGDAFPLSTRQAARAVVELCREQISHVTAGAILKRMEKVGIVSASKRAEGRGPGEAATLWKWTYSARLHEPAPELSPALAAMLKRVAAAPENDCPF